MNQHDLLKQLVENAMDFLSRSIDELDDHPKYSIIHFHAAVELFLKARLMAEHWSLVVSKRSDPDWDKFVVGDFMSVNLDEAADKLDKIVRSGLSKQELETFRRLTKHRNKIVHFFHKSVLAKEKEELRETIAKDQLTTWYLLYKALTVRWSDVFSPWSDNLKEIDARLRKLQVFLQVVFDQLESEIKKQKERGLIRDCPSCGFSSQEHTDEIGEFYEAKCLVCGLTDNCIMIECPDCGIPVLFQNEGFGECGDCERTFDPEYLVETLTDHAVAHIAAKEGDDSWQLGNCGDCDGFHTVVRLDEEGDRYLCASCFGEFDSIQCCGFCNELSTDDMTDSYWFGCNVCDGKGLE